MQADTAFSSKAHDIKIKQISLFIKLSFCSTLKGRRKNKAFTEVEDSATIAHEPYNKYNLETISCPSQTGPQNELRREERGEDCTQFLWDMPSTQTHWIWKLINCFGRTSSSGVRSIFKDASWSWQLGQMRHSSFSRSLQSHRKPQLIPRWKLTQLHQVRDCLLSLSAVRPLLYFQLRTEEASSGSWAEDICVSCAKVHSTCHAGFSSSHCWWVQRTALLSDVPTLWAQFCHGMKPGQLISNS